MVNTGPRYSREEFARRGEEIYQQDVKPTLRPDDEGKFVAIDIESRRFEIDVDDFSATDRLHKAIPGAQVWLMRVGAPAAHRIGGWPRWKGGT